MCRRSRRGCLGSEQHSTQVNHVLGNAVEPRPVVDRDGLEERETFRRQSTLHPAMAVAHQPHRRLVTTTGEIVEQ